MIRGGWVFHLFLRFPAGYRRRIISRPFWRRNPLPAMIPSSIPSFIPSSIPSSDAAVSLPIRKMSVYFETRAPNQNTAARWLRASAARA